MEWDPGGTGRQLLPLGICSACSEGGLEKAYGVAGPEATVLVAHAGKG